MWGRVSPRGALSLNTPETPPPSPSRRAHAQLLAPLFRTQNTTLLKLQLINHGASSYVRAVIKCANGVRRLSASWHARTSSRIGSPPPLPTARAPSRRHVQDV